MKRSDTHIYRLSSLLMVTLLLVAAPGTATEDVSLTDDDDITVDSLPFVPGQIVIRLAGNAEDGGEFSRLVDSLAIFRLQCAPIYLLQFDTSTNLDELAKRLQVQQGVAYAHPNYKLDSLHPVQGSRAFGDEEGNGDFRAQYAADMLELSTAHSMATGQGVKIGIVDGGIDSDHPVFENAVGGGYDYIDNDLDAFDEPGGAVSGHGTFVAGIIRLVAPDAEIVPYRVMDTCGAGDGFRLARAVEQAVYDGCTIINVSLALVRQHHAVGDAIRFAEEQGAIVVAAAGNGHTSIPTYPAAVPSAIAVAALDSQFVLAEFSNFGDHIDICAPGVELYSSYQDDIYAWWSGTSFAAPCVAGQVALALEILPDLDTRGVETLFKYSSSRLASYVIEENPEFFGLLGDWMVSTVDALAYGIVANLDANSSQVTEDFAVAVPGTYYIQPYRICSDDERHIYVRLYSTNAPAAYTAEYLPGSAGFSYLPPTSQAGETDTYPVRIYIDQNFSAEPGLYTDTIQFVIEGINEPVQLPLHLNISGICDELADSATVIILTEGYLTTEQGTGPESVDTMLLAVNSTNAPADFVLSTSTPIRQGFIDDFVGFWGLTPDTFGVIVSGTGLAPGIYRDTLNICVQNVANDKIPVELVLEVLPKETGSDLTNHPNPFNPSTTISFGLSEAADVELTIYNILGQEVACLVKNRLEAGEHSVLWPGTNSEGEQVGSGIYFCRLKQGTKVESKKMLMMK